MFGGLELRDTPLLRPAGLSSISDYDFDAVSRFFSPLRIEFFSVVLGVRFSPMRHAIPPPIYSNRTDLVRASCNSPQTV